MLSRRALIAAGATASAITLLPPALIKAAAASSTGSTQQENVSDYLVVTPSSDSSFASKINTLFPGILSDPIFQKIQAHAVLITNISNKTISACSTHWNATTSTGGYETILQHYFRPTDKRHLTSKFGSTGNKTRFTGAVSVFDPGETRLVTPYFNWSQDQYKANPKPQWKTILSQSASRQFFLYELSNASNIQVSIDAVIVSHKGLVGLDMGNLRMSFAVTRNAEHDEARSILTLVKGGASQDQIASVLQDHATSEMPSRDNAAYYLYCSVRRRQARVLYRRFMRATPARFTKTLEFLKSRPRTRAGIATVSHLATS